MTQTPPPAGSRSRARAAWAALLALVTLVLALPGAGGAALAAPPPAPRPAELPSTLRVGTEGVYPPFSFHQGSKLTGYDIDYFDEVARRLGVEVEYVETPWDSMFAALDSGRIDIIANQVTKNPERAARYDLTRPYVTTRGVVVVKDDDSRITKLEDLKGRSSAQNITSSWAAVAKRYGAQVVAVDAMDKAADLVTQGRVDALVNDELAVRNFLSTHPDSGLKIVAETPDVSESVFATKKGAGITGPVDEIISTMESDGTAKTIYDRYFGVEATAPSTWTVIGQNIGPMLKAVVTATIPLAAISFLLGLVLALLVALARLSANRLLEWPARAFVSLFRGTPLLVQLFLIFFGLPQLGLRLSPWPAAVIAFSLNVAAYAAEIIRSAILSVPQGQWEAASTIGMDRATALRRVILPQAGRVAVPPLSNTLISLVKDTSLASSILVTEMFRRAQIAAAPSGAFLELYGVAALIYWGICLVLSTIQTSLENRLGRHVAR
ncbi:ABC transporter substrate-binding protein/permease [Luteococcus peritonei]|uniref:ABC transporter substrate-binding protein/permease n=1 Tax=Luteococcus peritonei TaxID=88874 RepID=A0ABW4RYX1_9ACTN